MWNYTFPESKCGAERILLPEGGRAISSGRGWVSPARNAGNLAGRSLVRPPRWSLGSSDKTCWQGNRADTRYRGRHDDRDETYERSLPSRPSTCFESVRTNSCTALPRFLSILHLFTPSQVRDSDGPSKISPHERNIAFSAFLPSPRNAKC